MDACMRELILADLIAQGYQDDTLLEKCEEMQERIRPAVEAMLNEADEVARYGRSETSLDDIWGE